MIRVEIRSPDVAEHRGTNSRGPYVIRKQHGYLDVGKAYPVEVAINLGETQAPFAPGVYEIVGQCFYVRQFGEVRVDLSKLQRAAVPK